MKRKQLLVLIVGIGLIAVAVNWAISNEKQDQRDRERQIDRRIDNLDYWVGKAEAGIIPFNQDVRVPAAKFTGSTIHSLASITEDSPDVPVADANSTQSENSIFVDPLNEDVVLNSNNSTQNPLGDLYGANDLYTFDAGETWEGEIEGAGEDNAGDPTTAIGLNGRWYINYISSGYGMGISYSDDQGETWTIREAAPNPGSLADKNHMWIDNSPESDYEGNLYISWTNFGGSNDNEIGLSYSSDDGDTWTLNPDLSSAVGAGSHNQGVNIRTGPNGEVYAVWCIYDSWPSDESAIGFSRSLDGGETWDAATRIITNIRGIRTSETSKNMRVNSFPVAAVDISNGPDKGAIYVTWSNIGEPGINTGNDIDVYVIKSMDEGLSWSDPIRVNQDEAGEGHEHYMPWITVDPANGIVSLVFYDDRNVGGMDCEVYCANSFDGGISWEDFKVSDVSFTPTPIAGLAGGYFGDYLGITAQNGWVYPVWTDNRSGTAMAYVSPYQTNPLNRPRDLEANVSFETGVTDLIWSFEEAVDFLGFNVYRDGDFIGETTDTTYVDQLPDYGMYTYKVTAFYAGDQESGGTHVDVQWGDAHISVDPESIYQHLNTDEQATQYITVINTGQLELFYDITAITNNKSAQRGYCDASGGQDEHISRVEVGDIDNSTNMSPGGYGDYTDMSTTMNIGEAYPITVTNGNPWTADECGAWIDWNQNEEFEESEFVAFIGSPGNGPYTAEIVPPLSAESGSTRMRVRISYNHTPPPCGDETYGEVEDYTINVQGWMSINPMEGNILPGDTNTIAVNFDASDLEEGIYTAMATFYSNDPLVDQVEVDITLEVSEAAVHIETEEDRICLADSTALSATIYGEVTPNAFSWTSDPEGFVSDLQHIMVSPEEDTWYFVEATLENGLLTDSILIHVLDIPMVDLGMDTNLCDVDEFPLDAGNEGASYLWSTGEESQTIMASGNGHTIFWVAVTNQNNCTVVDSIQLGFGSQPMVDLGVDTIICHNIMYPLDAGNEGSYYLWSTGDTTQTMIFDANNYDYGVYDISVMVTNEFACVSSDTVNIEILDCTSIDEFSSQLTLKVFPNPNDGMFTVDLQTELMDQLNMSIVDQKGQVVYEQMNFKVGGQKKLEINLNAFPKGVYHLRVYNDNGSVNKKIVVK